MVFNIIGNYSCMRVLLYAKMLRETENEEARLLVTFLSLVAFRLGVPAPPPPLAMPMIVISMLFVILRFFALFCLFALVFMPSDTNGPIKYDLYLNCKGAAFLHRELASPHRELSAE